MHFPQFVQLQEPIKDYIRLLFVVYNLILYENCPTQTNSIDPFNTYSF